MTIANTAPDFKTLRAHPLVAHVCALADAAQGTAYLVGGAVRDWLKTGALPLDLDFTLVDCKAESLSRALADEKQGHWVTLDEGFGIYRIVFDDGWNVDLADALENSRSIDLARRDLTVNAMALDLTSGELFDPFQGASDLQNGVIRMVSEANLADDPLRLLRVFRIATTLQATQFDAETLAAVTRHKDLLWTVAGERIQYELFRMLSVTPCFEQLTVMAETGLLEVLIPDLVPMRAIGASGFHHLGLFEHTMELVKQAERLLPDCPQNARDWFAQALTPAATRFGLIKLGCLLHDIGKPGTKGTRPDAVHGERLTFYGHEELGEEMADPWLRQLKVSQQVREYIKKLIRWHLYPCQFGPDALRKSTLRFYRRMGDDTLDVVMLALADRHSACGHWLSDEDFEKSHQAHLWLMSNYEAEQPAMTMPRLLDGKSVMQLLDIKPGPHIGTVLEALQEAQQLGEVQDENQARAWVLERFAQP